MNRQWKVFFYQTADGTCPVQDFLDSLTQKERAKAVAWITLLQEQGINLHRPFADVLEEGIHELRMKITGDQIRVLYFFCFRDYVILTHEFVKNTDKVPLREIAQAKKCRKDFLNRYNETFIGRLYNDTL